MSLYKDNYDKIKWDKTIQVKKVAVSNNSKRSHLNMPYIAGDYKPYDCPITGKSIDGRVEHEENLKKHGCRIHEAGEFEDVKKNGQKRINASIDAAIDKSVDAIARQIDF
jgi:hypothetical protein|tara:strand:+ start:2776 stop:3105 length:330 start_codon:yes stop_codon:yes gene_type:complete